MSSLAVNALQLVPHHDVVSLFIIQSAKPVFNIGDMVTEAQDRLGIKSNSVNALIMYLVIMVSKVLVRW